MKITIEPIDGFYVVETWKQQLLCSRRIMEDTELAKFVIKHLPYVAMDVCTYTTEGEME